MSLNVKDSSRLKIFLNVLILFFSVYGVSKRDFSGQNVTPVEGVFSSLFSGMQGGVKRVEYGVSSFFGHYLYMVGVSYENTNLKSKIEELENQIFSLKELKRENERLKKLLQFGEVQSHQKILSQIIGWDSSGHFQVLRINKGSNDGIKLRSPVITNSGVVGHVLRLGTNHADVITILDQNNRLDVIVARTRSFGIVSGDEDSKCMMKYVARTEPVALRDEVITAGMGNIYPKGLKVGTITNIERESYGITQFIQITPSVEFRSLEEVIVLVPSDDQESDYEVKTVDGDL